MKKTQTIIVPKAPYATKYDNGLIKNNCPSDKSFAPLKLEPGFLAQKWVMLPLDNCNITVFIKALTFLILYIIIESLVTLKCSLLLV